MDMGKKFNEVHVPGLGSIVPPPSLRAFLPRAERAVFLASCRTDFPPLKIVRFLHSHNQAEKCTHREPGTGGGIRHSQIIARVYLSSRRCDAIDASRNNRWTFGSALTRSPPIAAPLRISARRVRGWDAPRRSSGGFAACERLAERRVVPSLNERVIYQARSV